MARTLHLSRFGLVIWLTAPVVLVAILWTQMDRSRGKPDPRLVHHRAASMTPTASPAPASAQPKMVEPESLAQGFVIVVEDKAKLANAASPIYFASSHNGWNPGDPARRLTSRSDGRWQIVLEKPTIDSRIGFKFTRGSWETVEVRADLSDLPDNRLLPLVDASKLQPGEKPIIELVVEKWRDQRGKSEEEQASNPYRAIKVSAGRIQRVQVIGGGVPIARDLLVWLPPGYDEPANASRAYPVLYMQDGQNLFEKHPRIPDEWRADETAGELIAQGKIEPLIIVGIPNSDARMSEYLPTAGLRDIPPRGDAYVEFMVNEVVPRVERSFRVKTGPEHTAVGGSSLGGLISLYAGLKHPEVFGKVLAESPSLRIGETEIWKAAFDGFKQGPRVIYLGMGGKEWGNDPAHAEGNRQLVASLDSFKAWLKERKIGEKVESVVEENAVHNEGAWAGRLPRALVDLYGG